MREKVKREQESETVSNVMFWKKFNACTMGAVVTGSSLIHPPVSYFYTHNFPPVYFKHM